jgi:hypothetical protein
MIIVKISFVNNKILSFIDCSLCVIEQIHKEFMDDFDVIMVGGFYQVPPI